jgi:hypothetical protein
MSSASFPAPVKGWIEDENLAANKGGGALVMDNWFPQQATVRMRGGALKVADVGSSPVLSIIPYEAPGKKLFVATAAAVYDVSAFNPNVTSTAAFSGQTAGYWSFVQFGTAAGSFLVMVNGSDNARYFNGTAWFELTQTSSPIALTGVNSATLSRVWMHGSRLWAIQKDTLDAWYLPVEQLGGEALRFPLGSVFKRGGELVIGASWSMDTGDGMDDRCVFVTDLGEVAVYQGNNPNDAAAWALVGRYDMGRPVGADTMQIGGDLLISTEDGLVPLSAVLTKDPAELSVSAASRAIQLSWQRAVRLKDPLRPFLLAKIPGRDMGIVGLPNRKETFVCNIQTGAWCRFTGWDVQSIGTYSGSGYYGDSLGNVFLIEGAGTDGGQIYTARLAWQPTHLRAPGRVKQYHMARATFRALVAFKAKLSVATDYGRDFPPAPGVEVITDNEARWDVGLWDVSRWDDSSDSEERVTATTKWRSLGRTGFSVSPQVQISSGSTRTPDAELVALDMVYDLGDMVV